MTRIPPADPSEYSEQARKFLNAREDVLGFVPNSMKVMARRPSIGEAFTHLSDTVIFSEELTTPVALRRMVQHVASYAAGCQYCQAHSVKTSAANGVDEQKLTEIWEFETSPLFNDAERIALRFALAAASVPNNVTDELMDEMREHYSNDEIVEILACVSFMGFANRWNDSLATTLEDGPKDIAERTIGKKGWTLGRHD